MNQEPGRVLQRAKPSTQLAILATALLASGLMGALGFLVDQGHLRFNYPSRSRFPVRGIDVSHHQGPIDWSAVASDGVHFAFIKATEGGDFTDKRFATNWEQARAAGLVVGAYHFFTLCRPAVEQARHFISVVPAARGTLPPVLDLEFGGNCSRRPTRVELLAELSVIGEAIRTHYGKLPIWYVTRDFLETYLLAEQTESPLWVRDIYLEPALEGGREWLFWQYANRGRIRGIKGPVDLNVFRGDPGQLAGWLQ